MSNVQQTRVFPADFEKGMKETKKEAGEAELSCSMSRKTSNRERRLELQPIVKQPVLNGSVVVSQKN